MEEIILLCVNLLHASKTLGLLPLKWNPVNLRTLFYECSQWNFIYESSILNGGYLSSNIYQWYTLYSEINWKSYCTHFLYCPAQLSWLDFTALYRPLRRVSLSLLSGADTGGGGGGTFAPPWQIQGGRSPPGDFEAKNVPHLINCMCTPFSSYLII